MARTQDNAKISFYKSRRKRGLGNEEIRKLWLEKKAQGVKQ